MKTFHSDSVAERKEIHPRLLDRVYHEDNLLVQRTSVFLTAHGLLIAALSLQWNAESPTIIAFGIVFTGAGFSLIQLALGIVSNSAISFWRSYLRRVEMVMKLPFDSALYDFYRDGSVDIIGGQMISGRASRSIRRGSLKSVPSMNSVIALLLPTVLTVFWVLLLAYFFWLQRYSWPIWLSLPLFPIMVLFLFRILPAPPTFR